MKKIMIIIALATAALVTDSCRKALDINDNPNIAKTAEPELLLPSAQVQLASALGVDMQVHGAIWSQYWTQSPTASQYRSIEQYAPTSEDFDRVWGLLYNGTLADLQKMQMRAQEQGRNSYIGIGKILSAYTFQLATDAWGDVPYSEALQGAPEDGLKLSPKYDAQSAIYNSLLQMVDDGIAFLHKDDPSPVSSDDLIYGGDLVLWEQFANSLKLKMLLRISAVDPAKASAGLATLSQDFITEDAQVSFVSTAGNRNPLSAEIQGLNYTTNLVASATSIDSLASNNDPRIDIFYEPYYNDLGIPSQLGLAQGNYNASPSTHISQPSGIAGANSNLNTVSEILAGRRSPVRLMTTYEVLFLHAEAAARGLMGGDADALFTEAVTANFTTYGLTDADAQDYMTNAYWGQLPSASGDAVRQIMTQKWFSLNGTQGFEAWTEYRRTGYPLFLANSPVSLIGSSKPNRFFYPSTELTRNQNFPGQKTITERVWWDVQ